MDTDEGNRQGIRDAVLRVVAVSKAFGPVEALRGVNLSVNRHEVLSLLGPNGAGKTTLLSIVCGLLRADSGSIHISSRRVRIGDKEIRKLVGLAPQDLAIYPLLSARDNLEYVGALARVPRHALQSRVDEVAEALSLTGLLTRQAGELSGGQQRRLHTALALLHEPPLLLLDEPTVGADVPTRQALLELVKGLAQRGTAVIYTTHYLSEVERLGGRVAMLVDGEICVDTSVGRLVAEHGRTIVEARVRDGTTLAKSSLPRGVDLLDTSATVEGHTVWRMSVANHEDVAALVHELARLKKSLVGFETVPPSMDEIFLSLTGRADGANNEGDIR